jgi:hypothetical protein
VRGGGWVTGRSTSIPFVCFLLFYLTGFFDFKQKSLPTTK